MDEMALYYPCASLTASYLSLLPLEILSMNVVKLQPMLNA